MIEQEPFRRVRTHFYHDASSYNMFRDRRVVEVPVKVCESQNANMSTISWPDPPTRESVREWSTWRLACLHVPVYPETQRSQTKQGATRDAPDVDPASGAAQVHLCFCTNCSLIGDSADPSDPPRWSRDPRLSRGEICGRFTAGAAAPSVWRFYSV